MNGVENEEQSRPGLMPPRWILSIQAAHRSTDSEWKREQLRYSQEWHRTSIGNALPLQRALSVMVRAVIRKCICINERSFSGSVTARASIQRSSVPRTASTACLFKSKSRAKQRCVSVHYCYSPLRSTSLPKLSQSTTSATMHSPSDDPASLPLPFNNAPIRSPPFALFRRHFKLNNFSVSQSGDLKKFPIKSMQQYSIIYFEFIHCFF